MNLFEPRTPSFETPQLLCISPPIYPVPFQTKEILLIIPSRRIRPPRTILPSNLPLHNWLHPTSSIKQRLDLRLSPGLLFSRLPRSSNPPTDLCRRYHRPPPSSFVFDNIRHPVLMDRVGWCTDCAEDFAKLEVGIWYLGYCSSDSLYSSSADVAVESAQGEEGGTSSRLAEWREECVPGG